MTEDPTEQNSMVDCTLSIGIDEVGQAVVVEFETPVKWVKFSRVEAEESAYIIMNKAEKLMRIEHEKRNPS